MLDPGWQEMGKNLSDGLQKRESRISELKRPPPPFPKNNIKVFEVASEVGARYVYMDVKPVSSEATWQFATTSC